MQDRATSPAAQALGAIHVINLARRQDRFDAFVGHIKQELAWPIPIVRYEACDTRQWDTIQSEVYKQSYVPIVEAHALEAVRGKSRRYWQDLTPGAVGCALSHTQLWSQLVGHRDWEYMFICEDDAVWNPEVAKMDFEGFVEKIQALPDAWDVLLLGGRPWDIYGEHDGVCRVRFFWQAHAYIVRKSAAWRLFTDVFPLIEPIDYHMSRKIIQAGLKMYMYAPALFVQRMSDNQTLRRKCSDINTNDVQSDMVMNPALDFTRLPK